MKIKHLLIIIYFLPLSLISQSSGISLTTSFGFASIEGHTGFSGDGELSFPVYKKVHFGINYNTMNSSKEINPEVDFLSQTFTSSYFDRALGDYHENVSRSQNSLGIQLSINIIESKRININVGGGINYNRYKMLDLRINSLNPDVIVTYNKWHQNGFGTQLSTDILYKISNSIAIGLKSRLMEYKDYNGVVMLATQFKLGQ